MKLRKTHGEKAVLFFITFALAALFGAGFIGWSIALGSDLPKEEANPLTASFSLDHGFTLHEMDNPDNQQSTSLTVTPIYSTGDLISLSAQVGAQMNWRVREEAFSLQDTLIGARLKGIPTLRGVIFAPGIALQIPTNQDSRRRASLIFGASVSPRLNFDFGAMGFLKGLKGRLQTSGSLFLHEFSTSTTGSANLQTLLKHQANLEFLAMAPFSLGMTGGLNQGFTYNGNLVEKFVIGETIGLALGDSIGVALSHENGGKILAANGIDSNISFFDENASTLSLGLEVNL